MSLPAELERMRRSDEPVEQVVEAGNATLAVTEQRLLALTPEAGGANCRAIERPNVEAVSSGVNGHTNHLRRALRPGILGVVLLGTSQFVNLDRLAGSTLVPEGTGQLGLGGLFATVELLIGVLATLDTLLEVGGLVLVCVALVLVAAYGYSRSPELYVAVAGGDDLRIPLEERPGPDEDPVTILQRGLGPAEPGPSEPSTSIGDGRPEVPTEPR